MPYPVRVILAAIPQVDPIKDTYDYVAFGAGIASMLFSVIAIFYAASAQRAARDARYDLAAERRRVFELEVLRDLVQTVDKYNLIAAAIDNPTVLHQFTQRLTLLAGTELPFWRRAVRASWRNDLVEELGHKEEIEQVNKEHVAHQKARFEWEDQVAWQAESDRLQVEVSAVQRRFEADVTTNLVSELHHAIASKINEGRGPEGHAAKSWWRPMAWLRQRDSRPGRSW